MFVPTSITPIDMFPHSEGCEVVVELKRRVPVLSDFLKKFWTGNLEETGGKMSEGLGNLVETGQEIKEGTGNLVENEENFNESSETLFETGEKMNESSGIQDETDRKMKKSDLDPEN